MLLSNSAKFAKLTGNVLNSLGKGTNWKFYSCKIDWITRHFCFDQIELQVYLKKGIKVRVFRPFQSNCLFRVFTSFPSTNWTSTHLIVLQWSDRLHLKTSFQLRSFLLLLLILHGPRRNQRTSFDQPRMRWSFCPLLEQRQLVLQAPINLLFLRTQTSQPQLNHRLVWNP